MAPDAIHSQVLSPQWDLTWAALPLSTVKMPAHNSPLTPEQPAADLSTMVSPKPSVLQTFPMFRNLQQYLWGALQRVLRRLWVTKELLSSTRVFLFLCSGYRAQAAMKADAEKSIMGRGGAEGEEVVETRPDQTSASMLKTQVEEEMEVLQRRIMEVEEEEEEEWETEAEDMEEFTDEEEEEEESDSDRMEWGSDEEDDGVEDEDALHQQTSPTTGSCVGICLSLNSKQANEEEEEGKGDEEEDSEWSEEEDEDDDSEASAESVELWESFLQSDDPYNPLSFSSCVTSNTHTSPINGESRTGDWEEEEEREDRQHSTRNIQQKKVRFSDEVTVHPLVDWAIASREARDGSCWIAMALDRARFRRRVEDAGKVISLCLSPEHRCLVWEKLQKQSAL